MIIDKNVRKIVEHFSRGVARRDACGGVHIGYDDHGHALIAGGFRHIDGHGVSAGYRVNDEYVALLGGFVVQNDLSVAGDTLHLAGHGRRGEFQHHTRRTDGIDGHHSARAVKELQSDQSRMVTAEAKDSPSLLVGGGKYLGGSFHIRGFFVEDLGKYLANTVVIGLDCAHNEYPFFFILYFNILKFLEAP